MKPEGFLPCLKGPPPLFIPWGVYKCNPCIYTLFMFNYNLSSRPSLWRVLFHIVFLTGNLYVFFIFSMHATWTATHWPSHCPWLEHRTDTWWIVEIMKLLSTQLSRPPATSSVLGLPLNYWYKLVSSICPRNNSVRRTERLTFYPGAGLVLLLVSFYRSIAAALSHSVSLKRNSRVSG